MEVGTSVADSELPKLKSLASELLAAESLDLAVLDQIAALAAEIAARCREETRRQLVELVAKGAQAIFPTAAEDLRSRLAQSSLDELSSLGALLGDAMTARTAFARADSGLMTARDRGDYAAMAPLALEADTQKSALAAAGAEFANRIGLGGALTPDTMPATAAEESARAFAAVEASNAVSPREAPAVPPPSGAPEADFLAASSMPEDLAGIPAELDLPPGAPAERRRIRDLIRQIRPTPDEAP